MKPRTLFLGLFVLFSFAVASCEANISWDDSTPETPKRIEDMTVKELRDVITVSAKQFVNTKPYMVFKNCDGYINEKTKTAVCNVDVIVDDKYNFTSSRQLKKGQIECFWRQPDQYTPLCREL